ncbi:MAG: hypothetical protein IKW81_14140 [Pseudobutyrivibrio sp.]|nr:hypothetical protein [Pseudobutyrivibrio sp.]
MFIKKVAFGNREEAFVEEGLIDGINIIFSDDNNKGKTVFTQSILHTFGNKSIFPDGFNPEKYMYYVQFEHNNGTYDLLRVSDIYILNQPSKGVRMFEDYSEFKRYFSDEIMTFPKIIHDGKRKIVDMELYSQLFFVGQDNKNTSSIFNSGYYHKDDFISLISSYAVDEVEKLDEREKNKIKTQIRVLTAQRKDNMKLNDFYKSSGVAAEYLSKSLDNDSFKKTVGEMSTLTEEIGELRRKRLKLVNRRNLWLDSLKDLRSLNRTVQIGELRCMDCNSNHISYKGKGKTDFSFDVSTPEIRSQIIGSIEQRIESYLEEIEKCDCNIKECQEQLQSLINEENISLENIIAYKKGFLDAQEIEKAINNIDEKLENLNNTLNSNEKLIESYSKKQRDFIDVFISKMNEVKNEIDLESQKRYENIFTKRGVTISGSDVTVYYFSRIIAAADLLELEWPVIMDSFRAEDLSTEKEELAIKKLKELDKQCILTTTLKDEENHKYKEIEYINDIDYSSHCTNRILSLDYVDKFKEIVEMFGVEM